MRQRTVSNKIKSDLTYGRRTNLKVRKYYVTYKYHETHETISSISSENEILHFL